MQLQQGDIKLIDGSDGIDFELVNGVLSMTGGLDTAVYLSLFGDNGLGTWMNDLLSGSSKITSKAIPFALGLPITSSNIQTFEKFLQVDLQWLKDDLICDTININIEQTAKNSTKTTIELLTNGELLYKNDYKVNWNYQSEGQ